MSLMIPPFTMLGNVAAIRAGDVTAPTLSSGTDTATSSSTASLSVTTNEANGTLYWVVTTSVTAPTKAQVKLGQDHTSAAAADADSQAVSSTGAQAISGGATGLSSGTQYYAHFMHEDAVGNQSTVASGDGFVTYLSDIADLDNLYGIYSLKQVRSAYGAGNLVRLRRVSDSVEADYAAGGDGWIDGSAITTWLGGSSARVVTMYDQSGNARNYTQATAGNQPSLDLSGSHPRIQFTSSGTEYLTGASVVAFARNISGSVSVAHVGIVDVSTTVAQQVVWFSGGSSATAHRISMNTGVSSGLHGARARAVDGGSSSDGGTIAADTTTWVTRQMRWEVGAGRKRHQINTTTSDATFTGTTTSDTDSLNAAWGAVGTGIQPADMKATALFLIQDALSDTEMSALYGFCEALKAA